MPLARSIKLTLAGLTAFVALAALSLVLRHKPSPPAGGMAGATAYDFGELVQGQPLEHEFVWRNDGREPLAVDAVIMGAGSALVAADSLVPAGGEGKLRVRVDSRRPGPVNALVKVRYKAPEAHPTWFVLRGRVVAPVEVAPSPELYFFTFQGEGPERELAVINHQGRPLELQAVRSDNPRFRVRSDAVAAGSRYRLSIALDPATPVGRDSAHITLTTDSPDYPTLSVRALAYVDDLVSAFPKQVDFGQIAYGHIDGEVIGKKVILVQKHRGGDFQVLSAALDVPYMDVEVVPQRPGQSFLVSVKIVKARARPGDIHGTLRIKTNDPAVPEFALPLTGKML